MPCGKRPPKHRAADQHSISSLFSAAKRTRESSLTETETETETETQVADSANYQIQQDTSSNLTVPNDVGALVDSGVDPRHCSDEEKLRYLQGHFKPGLDFSPISLGEEEEN